MIPDEVVVAGVLAMRFLVPLTMLRYPLPGMVASIAADAVDGAILSAYSDLTRENKQNYDKALDTYYLAIAYIAVLRNWTDPVALGIARVLWYLRLSGVALFAVTGSREVLIFFPASFEFFFICYEAARTRWMAWRLTRAHLVVSALAVTFLLKVPQELFIHMARLSVNDLAKEHIFGVDPSVSRMDAAAANPWGAVALLAALGLLLAAAWYASRWLPRPDHATVFDADAQAAAGPGAGMARRRRSAGPVLSRALLEKVALVSLISIVFAEFLPGVQASAAQMIGAVSIFIVVNAVISDWIARRGAEWRTAVLEFLAMSVINAAIVLGILTLSRWTNATIDGPTALLYVFLLTLLITLYDRYRALEAWRVAEEHGVASVTAAEAARP